MLFGITLYAVLLYTAGINTINISSNNASFIILFLSECHILGLLMLKIYFCGDTIPSISMKQACLL